MGMGNELGKFAGELVKNEFVQNKVTSIVGMLFPYVGIEKKALDMYISDIESSNMSSESKLMAVLNAKDTIKKLKNQNKISNIAIENAKEGTDFTRESGVDQDWLDRFMDSAGFVSSDTVQLMWGKILAKEFETPGSTPLNMIRVLSEITPTYANAFRKICCMQSIFIEIDCNGNIMNAMQRVLVPYNYNEEYMQKLGLNFGVLNELETLGLIKFNTISGYVTKGIKEKTVLSYINGKAEEIFDHNNYEIPIGNVMLTKVGECLKNITQLEPIPDYDKVVKKYMSKKNVKYKEETDYQIIESGNEILVKKK